MLLKRSTKKEMMDDFSINDDRIDAALDELKIINRFLGGNSVSKKGVEEFNIKTDVHLTYRILDVGSGSSDVLLKIRDRFKSLEICALDKNRQVCNYSKRKNNLNIICGDVFSLPVKDQHFDIIHASLFLHHFSKNEIMELISIFLFNAKKGLIINELRRNVFALIGIKIFTFLFSKNEFVKNDAPLSVRRGFLKKELKNILMNVPASGYIIKRKWAFRWLIVVIK